MPRIYRTFFNVWVANGWKAENFEENRRHFGSNEIWTIYNIIRNSSLCGARMPSKRNFYSVRFFKEEIFPGVRIDPVAFASLVAVYVHNHKLTYIGAELH